MDDREAFEGLRLWASELRPNQSYRKWIYKVKDGEAIFELSPLDTIFDEILDEMYGSNSEPNESEQVKTVPLPQKKR